MTTIHGKAYGTGRRKNAVARVFLKAGTGNIIVNGKAVGDYFPRPTSQMIVRQALESGQAGAVRHGISRALLVIDPAYRGKLKENGFLTRDARKKERKKPGQPGARKRFQYSKR